MKGAPIMNRKLTAFLLILVLSLGLLPAAASAASAPSIGTLDVLSGNEALLISWPRLDVGGSDLTSLSLTVQAQGYGQHIPLDVGERSYALAGLENGKSYTITVFAKNADGSDTAMSYGIPKAPAEPGTPPPSGGGTPSTPPGGSSPTGDGRTVVIVERAPTNSERMANVSLSTADLSEALSQAVQTALRTHTTPVVELLSLNATNALGSRTTVQSSTLLQFAAVGASLRLTNRFSSLELGSSALEILAGNANGGSVAITVMAEGEGDLKDKYVLSTRFFIEDSTGNALDFGAEDVELTLNYPVGFAGKPAAVFTRSEENGRLVYVETRTAEKSVTFLPFAHASYYAVALPYEDMKNGDAFFEAAAKAYLIALMNGTTPTTFSPAETVTRGMLATLLYRMAGSPAVSGSAAFPDVAAGQYYHDPVVWAVSKGVISGYPDGSFKPTDPVTREQLAVMLYRYAKAAGISTDIENPLGIENTTDRGSIAPYALEAMTWAYNSRLIMGTGTLLSPTRAATRGETAQILIRFTER